MQTLADFTSQDAVDSDLRAPYDELSASLEAELCPVGLLETFYAAQIQRAIWRIQQYQQLAKNPDIDKILYRLEKSLGSGLKQLRSLQSERQVREQPEPDQWGSPRGQGCEAVSPEEERKRERETNPTNSAETKRTQPIPRSAACPCGSGQKYKRCCGVGAAPVLHGPDK